MERDGNGWVRCAHGHTHWGVHGAAGLLLHAVDDSGQVRVLLQHRAAWSHNGNTWGLPGGARDSHEAAAAAALREAAEETGLDPGTIRVRHSFVDDHGGWSYTTVYADTPAPVATELNAESVALEWLAPDEVAGRVLHPGFAATWSQVRVRPVVLLVDVANVVGSRPDGWWRDRAGAAGRLLAGLVGLRAVTVRGPDGSTAVIGGVVAVLEGAAVAAAAEPGWVRVVRAGASGDDALVHEAAHLVGAGQAVLAVTADRALRARLDALAGPGDPAPRMVGPRWLLGSLAEEGRLGPRTGEGPRRS